MDPTKIFSSKAQVYARYRPDFAPQAIATLKDMIGLPHGSLVVDVGAGTGTLTRHLLGHFATVCALEPNPEMLAAAVDELGDFPGFRPLAARVEGIPLTRDSVDLITAGQVMYWLQPEPTRVEFRRIAKPCAWLAIAYHHMVDERLLEAIRELRTPENGFHTRVDDPLPGDVPPEYYFVDEQFQTLNFSHTH